MHKYSYELSSSYRQETFRPHQYLQMQGASPTPAPSHHLPIRPNDSYHRQSSKTFIRSTNQDMTLRPYPLTYRPTAQANFQRSSSGFKVRQVQTKPPQWRQNDPHNVQNRLQILNDLGQRQQKAIHGINFQAPSSHQTPIRALYDEPPRNYALKREFSFNRLPAPQKNQEEFAPKEYNNKPEPLNSKNQYADPQLKKKSSNERPQLRIYQQQRGEGEGLWRKQNTGNTLKLIKTIQPTQTVAKLSSLQERIKNTVQPYLRR